MASFDKRHLLVILWILGLAGTAMLLVATYGRTWRFDYQAKISQLSVCSGLDPVTKAPIPVTHPLTTDAKDISVCAYLEGVGSIPLEFLWRYNGQVLTVKRGDYYQPGYITSKLTAPAEGFRAGKYSVLIYLGRCDLASSEFLVERP